MVLMFIQGGPLPVINGVKELDLFRGYKNSSDPFILTLDRGCLTPLITSIESIYGMFTSIYRKKQLYVCIGRYITHGYGTGCWAHLV